MKGNKCQFIFIIMLQRGLIVKNCWADLNMAMWFMNTEPNFLFFPVAPIL